MPNDRISADALCPYYKAHTGQSVSCLWMGGSELMIRFMTPERRTRHIEKYCTAWDYRRCPLAAMMDKAYAGERVMTAKEKAQGRRMLRGSAPLPRPRDISLGNSCAGGGK